MNETLSNGVSEQNQEQKKVKNNGESKAFKVKGKPKSYYVKRALGDYCKAMAEFESFRFSIVFHFLLFLILFRNSVT